MTPEELELKEAWEFCLKAWAEMKGYAQAKIVNDISYIKCIEYLDDYNPIQGKYGIKRSVTITIDHPFMHALIEGLKRTHERVMFIGHLMKVKDYNDIKMMDALVCHTLITAKPAHLAVAYYRAMNLNTQKNEDLNART